MRMDMLLSLGLAHEHEEEQTRHVEGGEERRDDADQEQPGLLV